MKFEKKRIILFLGILVIAIILITTEFQSNKISIHDVEHADFLVEHIGESYRTYLELEIDQYNELKYDKSENAVIIFPTFTSIAYQDNGFYYYFTGICDETCITLEIPKDIRFTHIGSKAFFLLTYLGYPSITDIEVDKNPEILREYDKVIVLHNEYVTKKEFNAITSHPKVVFLYPNALYAEIETDYDKNVITLVRGHSYPEKEIANGFDWEFENTNPYEYDLKCNNWDFYEITNGIMLNCYPQNVIFDNLDMIKKIKDF